MCVRVCYLSSHSLTHILIYYLSPLILLYLSSHLEYTKRFIFYSQTLRVNRLCS